jgi:PAS domain S-box-containing protein
MEAAGKSRHRIGSSATPMFGQPQSHPVTALPSAWKRYAFAALCIAASAVGRWISLRWFAGAYATVPTFLAAIVAAWYGGFGPSLLVSLSGLFLTWLMPPEIRGPRVGHPLVGLAVYIGYSLGIAALGGLMARARRRIAEQIDELASQREELSATLHSIGDAVIVTDGSGRIVSMNPVAESITGWTITEAASRPLEDVFRIENQETRSAVESPVERVLREGQVVGLANHTILIAKDGSERPIDDSAAPIHDAAGKLAGVVLVFRDVTERRQSERQLQDEARRKDEFLALLAHELRNPLAPIRSALDVLRLAGDDPEAALEAREVAERQLRHMTRLVDDLLDVSRIMRGKVELRKERIELAAAVTRCFE